MKLFVKIITIIYTTVLMVDSIVEASISVSNVVCQQQYPWNGKVDIDYEIYGDESATNIWISAEGFDKVTNKKINIRSLSGPGILKPAKTGRQHVVWNSLKDCPGLKTSAFSITLSAINGKPLYMVIDLSGGPEATSYPISYLMNEPAGGWTEEYKTTKMVLRLIPSGKFTMGSPSNEIGRFFYEETLHEVIFKKNYYIGVFEVTQKQYELIMGSNPSFYKGDTRPVEGFSYDMLRGNSKGTCWPANNEVDEDSFFGKLRAKTFMTFDLPTEAQWEYACRAGTITALNSGKNLSNESACNEMAEVGRYSNNLNDGKGGFNKHTSVGSYLPNAWGLFDMHGNVYEWCLDWFQDDLGTSSVTDPVGAETGTFRVLRGGSWFHEAYSCRSADRGDYGRSPGYAGDFGGFRVVLIQ